VTHLNVDNVSIDVHKDSLEVFVANLNSLMPGLGDRYAIEPGLEDTELERDYLWGEWESSLNPGGEHRQKLRDAVEHLLGRDGPVDVTGEYKGNKRDVLKEDSPKRLIFRAKENEDPGDEGKIHRAAPED
jgi:hypothetical protein